MKSRSSGDPTASNKPARPRPTEETPVRRVLRGVALCLFLWITWTATHVFYTSPDHVDVVVGEASPRDIKAPRQVTYISEIKTDEARRLAASQVPEVFVGPDMEVANQQLQTLDDVTAYIGALRHDEYASQDEKLELIGEIPTLDIPSSAAVKMLDIEDEAWDGAVAETSRVLDLVMRDEIRPGQIADARRQVHRLTTRALSSDQRAIVLALTQSLVAPNTFFDPEQTAAQRKSAREAVEPVHWTIREGESVLREGEIVSELAMEKLRVLNLLNSELDWRKAVGVGLLFAVLVATMGLYIARSHPLLLGRPRRELLLTLVLMTVGVTSHLIIPGRALLPYIFPTAAAVMLVAILVDVQLAMLVAIVSAILVSYSAGGSVELTVYALAGGVVGGLVIWRMEHMGAFFRAAVYVTLANVTVILGFRLRSFDFDAVGLAQMLSSGIINGLLSSSLTFVAFAFIGRIFGIATSLQLLELARPTHPLFRQVLIKAPGTYHHSILVSNMAERAAEAIGADALLARVGSYYHDVGKTLRPYFFGENQNEGENPHDDLDPKTSADIILSHTREGLALARKYKLPDRVSAFIPEHHGTTLVSYFYRRATQASDGEDVDENDFRYDGPRPQSKETAIVMLADSIEAWVRANRPATQAEMERVVRRVINDRLISGELDECDLTLKDLDRIREAFIGVLQGIFHPRIQYPERVVRRNGRSGRTPAQAPSSPLNPESAGVSEG